MTEELREPTFFILLSLADGPKHGYAVMTLVSDLSGGRIRLRAGTLYAALTRLVDQGLVAEAGSEVVEGRNRRYMEITIRGLAALTEEGERQRANAVKVSDILRGIEVATA